MHIVKDCLSILAHLGLYVVAVISAKCRIELLDLRLHEVLDG